jgi:hypothetical protein
MQLNHLDVAKCDSVIPATQEAGIGRTAVESQPGQKLDPISKNK